MSSNTSSTTPIPSTPIPPVVDEGMSGGTAFCLFFFFICFVYFGGGIIVRKFLRGAEGPEIIPHYEFWNDIPNLVKDGIMFTINGCQPDVSYERI